MSLFPEDDVKKLLLTHLACSYNTVREAHILEKHKSQGDLKHREKLACVPFSQS